MTEVCGAGALPGRRTPARVLGQGEAGPMMSSEVARCVRIYAGAELDELGGCGCVAAGLVFSVLEMFVEQPLLDVWRSR